MRSSCNVMSCGVPKVVNVVIQESRRPPTLNVTLRNGALAGATIGSRQLSMAEQKGTTSAV